MANGQQVIRSVARGLGSFIRKDDFCWKTREKNNLNSRPYFDFSPGISPWSCSPVISEIVRISRQSVASFTCEAWPSPDHNSHRAEADPLQIFTMDAAFNNNKVSRRHRVPWSFVIDTISWAIEAGESWLAFYLRNRIEDWNVEANALVKSQKKDSNFIPNV